MMPARLLFTLAFGSGTPGFLLLVGYIICFRLDCWTILISENPSFSKLTFRNPYHNLLCILIPFPSLYACLHRIIVVSQSRSAFYRPRMCLATYQNHTYRCGCKVEEQPYVTGCGKRSCAKIERTTGPDIYHDRRCESCRIRLREQRSIMEQIERDRPQHILEQMGRTAAADQERIEKERVDRERVRIYYAEAGLEYDRLERERATIMAQQAEEDRKRAEAARQQAEAIQRSLEISADVVQQQDRVFKAQRERAARSQAMEGRLREAAEKQQREQRGGN